MLKFMLFMLGVFEPYFPFRYNLLLVTPAAWNRANKDFTLDARIPAKAFAGLTKMQVNLQWTSYKEYHDYKRYHQTNFHLTYEVCSYRYPRIPTED